MNSAMMSVLDRGEEARDVLEARSSRTKRWRVRLARLASVLLVMLLVVAVGVAVLARRDKEWARANLARAREAVDESLTAFDRDPLRAGADLPQFQAFRRVVLDRAERFYSGFLGQPAVSEPARLDLAIAHVRLGQINRMRGQLDDAAREYRDAADRLRELVRADPG